MSCLTKACRYLADDCVKEWRLIKASDWNNSTAARVLRLSEWVLIWRWLILCDSTDFRYEIRQIHQIQRPTDYDQTNQHPPRKNRRKGLVATKVSSCCKLVNNGCDNDGGFIKTGQHSSSEEEEWRTLTASIIGKDVFTPFWWDLVAVWWTIWFHCERRNLRETFIQWPSTGWVLFFFLKRPPLSKCCLWAPDGHVKHTLWMYETLCPACWVITKYDMNQT